jgi:hypothetical protein
MPTLQSAITVCTLTIYGQGSVHVLDLSVLQSVRIHLGVGPGHVHPGRGAVQLVLLLPLLLDKQTKNAHTFETGQ